jgi:hypothetical protein
MDQIELALAALGSTPTAVAETLRAAGVAGRRDSPSVQNVLVRYLNRTVDIGGRLEVGASGEVVYLYRGGSAVSFRVPDPVREFLAAFHRGDYPDLEQP